MSKDGGPAFPHGELTEGTYGMGATPPHGGMSLRDYFAAHALAGMLAHSRNGHGYRPRDPEQPWHEAIAQESYELADAMLAEREKNDV